MYENDELLMAEDMEEAETLIKELSEMQVRFSETGHESFAVWRAKWITSCSIERAWESCG
jgi:hypothetical protein